MFRFWKIKNELKKANDSMEYWKSEADKFFNEKIIAQKRCGDLEEKVDELQHIISEYKAFDNIIKESTLPKCESILCRSCVYCCTQFVNGEVRIVGCKKDIECKEYKASTNYIPMPYAVTPPNYFDYRNTSNTRFW